MGLITAFSLLPVPEVGAPKNSDRIAHFIMYLITCGAFYFTFRRRIKKIILGTGVFSFAYGLLMELAQAILPYREFSLEDLFANTAGVALMLLYLVARDNLKSS
jgi:VanZ family protein